MPLFRFEGCALQQPQSRRVDPNGPPRMTERKSSDRVGNARAIMQGVVVAGLGLVCALTLRAQRSERVGHIDEVRRVDSSAVCSRDIALSSPPIPVSLLRRTVTIPVLPPDTAVLLDKVRVPRYTDVRFRIDAARFGDGTFFFAPSLVRCAQVSVSRELQGLGLSSSGVASYRLSSRQERLGGRTVDRLLLSVENGSVVVEWRKGLLSVIALGREIKDSGTVFAVVVDSSKQRALLIIRDGLVTMPGVTDLQATAGKNFLFGTKGQPEQVELTSQLLNAVTYHSRDIWSPRRSNRFWKVFGGTAVVSLGGYLVWRQLHKTDASRNYNGLITIQIPI